MEYGIRKQDDYKIERGRGGYGSGKYELSTRNYGLGIVRSAGVSAGLFESYGNRGASYSPAELSRGIYPKFRSTGLSYEEKEGSGTMHVPMLRERSNF